MLRFHKEFGMSWKDLFLSLNICLTEFKDCFVETCLSFIKLYYYQFYHYVCEYVCEKQRILMKQGW